MTKNNKSQVVASCSVLYSSKIQDFFVFTSSNTNIRDKWQSINTKNITVLWRDTRHSCSELLPSWSELKHDIHGSCSELLPRYSELTHDKHRSYSELFPSYSELKHDTHRSCSKRLPCYLELEAIVLIIASLSYFSSPLSWNTWRIDMGY